MYERSVERDITQARAYITRVEGEITTTQNNLDAASYFALRHKKVW